MHSYHSNATTNIHIRELLNDNPDSQSCRALAARFSISAATACKWRRSAHRRHLMDAGSRPRRIRFAFTAEQQQLLLHLRTTAKLSLDALLEAVRQTTIPHATRSSVYRLLVRHGLQRSAAEAEAEAEPPRKHGAYHDEGRAPGFVHIDSFVLMCGRPAGKGKGKGKAQRRQHCFVAVDRATRMAYLHVYDSYASASACDFLERCRAFFPFAVHTVLTDNGAQYTLKAAASKKHARGCRTPFEQMCRRCAIQHKTTRPYTPKTNGLVERVNGLIQSETIKRHRYQSQAERDQALTAWMNHYNLTRRHRRIPIGAMTPLEAAGRWQARQPNLFSRLPSRNTLLQQSCSQPPGT